MIEVHDPAEVAGTWLESCLNTYISEQKLCFAMISRALLDLHSPDQKIRRDARRWLFQAHPDYIFSFSRCCDECGFNLDDLRERALQLSHMHEAEIAKAARLDEAPQHDRSFFHFSRLAL